MHHFFSRLRIGSAGRLACHFRSYSVMLLSPKTLLLCFFFFLGCVCVCERAFVVFFYHFFCFGFLGGFSSVFLLAGVF